MSGYSGETVVTLVVQRDDEELSLDIEGRAFFQPGRLSGPPEDCYPDEGDVEVLSVSYNGTTWPGKLTAEELEAAENLIDEAVREGTVEEPYDRYEDD